MKLSFSEVIAFHDVFTNINSLNIIISLTNNLLLIKAFLILIKYIGSSIYPNLKMINLYLYMKIVF